jgi:dihydrolipoamide dehydrogenase
MLAHKMHEGRTAVETIAGHKNAFEPTAIPAVVFTDPEIAGRASLKRAGNRDARSASPSFWQHLGGRYARSRRA